MKQAEAKTLSTDVYRSFVTSLFGNRGTLLTGMIIHIVACAVIYATSGSIFFLLLIAVFIFTFAYRLYWFHRFDLIDPAALTVAEIQGWETRYVSGAALTASMLGIACAYALVVLREMGPVFICIAITMGSMVSI